MAYIIGPNSPNFKGRGAAGLGAEGYPIVGSWTAVGGKAGEVIYVDVGQVAVTVGAHDAFCVMAAAACNLKYTLQHPAFACNPDADVQAKVLWGNDQTPAVGTIETCEAPLFTAVRVELTADGEVYFYSR
ncbi:hypothetical protein [Achromobacter phage Motura]|uniref:Uncharacterized protein n=1 Tax=Achromobacter phage Motura TaxID=2591403 RepID=A0A514CT14_9CAUD|nr:hypothetical protein H1O15_gp184 [Achromobacter phage Motura]QDH83604.1 hypothetical protein [Achromobacter phage Motura]